MRYILLFVPLLVGCYVNPTDKTPPAFPMDAARDQARTPAGADPAKWYYAGAEKHRFKLTVGSGMFVGNVRAFVTIDGQEHPMIESPSDLFHFDATDLCRPAYQYSFRVAYSACGQPRSARLPEDGSTKTVNVTRFGDVIWFVPPGPVHFLGDGAQSLDFTWGTESTRQTIIVRNLTSQPFEIHHVGLVNAPGATDNSQFSVSPTLLSGQPSIRLDCGQELLVSVTWNAPNNPQSSATGALQINGTRTDRSTNTDWNLLLFLQGVPHPP